MTTRRRILIEGYTPETLLQLSDEELRAFVFTDEPLVFQAGSAQILGQFQVKEDRLIVELAQHRSMEAGKASSRRSGRWPSIMRATEGYPRWSGLYMRSTAPNPI